MLRQRQFSFSKNASLGTAGREGVSEETGFPANTQTDEMMQQEILHAHNSRVKHYAVLQALNTASPPIKGGEVKRQV